MNKFQLFKFTMKEAIDDGVGLNLSPLSLLKCLGKKEAILSCFLFFILIFEF